MAKRTEQTAEACKLTARQGRSQVVKLFNELAAELNVDMLSCRPSASEMTACWSNLCGAAEPHHAQLLQDARTAWREHHGGGDLPDDLLPDSAGRSGAADDASGLLENHRIVREATTASRSKKPFHLKSKAFLLTFNSAKFSDGKALWDEFLIWITNQAQQYGATQWSAAMEHSLHATQPGTVHLHAYFSWVGAGVKGVDCRGTGPWAFRQVKPRIDCNSEQRGPSFWLKAVQRGHFYCSAHKKGAVYTATNYPPWNGIWAPDAAWVVALYRQHKLDHDAYLRLSTLLRDGHERRKASVEAAKSSETAVVFEEERCWAREQIKARSLPFKPLLPAVECWKMSYEEVEERYRMLVLFGPSRTGKSRLARSLFGESRTLVVDVQHADHPDLHGFKRHHHLAVLLDEVASPKFIAGNKKLLQAHVDGAILGQSATQLYTYEVRDTDKVARSGCSEAHGVRGRGEGEGSS